MMVGPNFERTKALVEAVDVSVVASGGVNTIEDIKKLAEFNPEAAIIGRSLVVHADADDMQTQPTGGAGDRLACGVIGIAR